MELEGGIVHRVDDEGAPRESGHQPPCSDAPLDCRWPANTRGNSTEAFRAEELSLIQPLATADFSLILDTDVSRASISELIHTDGAAALVCKEPESQLQEAMHQLLGSLKPFSEVHTIPLGSEEELVKTIMDRVGLSPEQHPAAQILYQDIVNEISQFGEATQVAEVDMRLLSTDRSDLDKQVIQIFNPDLQKALAAISQSIEGIGYHDSFVYHKDDFGVNLVKSYAGPTTLAISPNAIGMEQGFALVDAWTAQFYGEDGAGRQTINALQAGDRQSALRHFGELIEFVREHQLYLAGSGVVTAAPHEFPALRSTVYLGNLEENWPEPANLLLHARPMWFLSRPAEKRLGLLLATKRQESVAHLF